MVIVLAVLFPKTIATSQLEKWDPELDILSQRPGYILQIENLYASTDFSKDGEVVALQTHSKGNGITIVMMGDQFVDTDMENDGLYETK